MGKSLVDFIHSCMRKTAFLSPYKKPKNPWDDKYTVGDTVRSIAKGTGLTSGPLSAGLIMGGAGALAGVAAAPAIKYLYPEAGNMSGKKIGLGAGLLAGGSAAGLAYILSKAKQRNDAIAMAKRSYYSPGGLPTMAPYGGNVDSEGIRKEYLRNATNPLLKRMPGSSPLMGQAFQNTVMNAPGSVVNQRQLNQQARSNGLFSSVGSYLDPRKRVGFALMGAGAQGMTNALGISDKLKNTFGMPVSQAVRSYMPAARMFTRGLSLFGS